MNKVILQKFLFLSVLPIGILLSSCGQETTPRGGVINEWLLSDPNGLHPYNTTDANSTFVSNHIFQRLMSFHHNTYELVPVLAKSKPEVTLIGDSLTEFTFELREGAEWDNGSPITAADVAFSFKAAITPGVDNAHLKPYLANIADLRLYEGNDRKITIICDEVYMRAEITVSFELYIIPSHIYDPEGHLENYNFADLRNIDPAMDYDELRQFAEIFNSEKYIREKGFVIGSGPYEFVEWNTGQRIVISRKDNWWGDKVENGNMFFEAYPDRMNFIIINDQTSAINALKAGELDVMRLIPPKVFKKEMQENDDFKGRYNLFTPPTYAWTYMGINVKEPKLRDRQTRKALAHLVNYDRILNDLSYGFGKRIVGPVSPLAEAYNEQLEPYKFNIEQAKDLLSQAGWENTNGDETVDKMIDGEQVELEINFMTVSGNEERQKAILIFQEAAARAGVKINIQVLDWSIMREKLRSHDYDMFYSAWSMDPPPNDQSQLWHTEQINNGSNYVQFGNAKTDALLERINSTLDAEKRNELFKKFQEVLHEEVPYIFLFALQNRIAIHNRFANTHVSAQRPGYYLPGFKLTEAYREQMEAEEIQ